MTVKTVQVVMCNSDDSRNSEYIVNVPELFNTCAKWLIVAIVALNITCTSLRMFLRITYTVYVQYNIIVTHRNQMYVYFVLK